MPKENKLEFDTRLFDSEFLNSYDFKFNENNVCTNDYVIVQRNDNSIKCEISICKGTNSKWSYSYNFMVRKGHGGGGVSPCMAKGEYNTPQEAVLAGLNTAIKKYFNDVPAFRKELNYTAYKLEEWIKDNTKNEDIETDEHDETEYHKPGEKIKQWTGETWVTVYVVSHDKSGLKTSKTNPIVEHDPTEPLTIANLEKYLDAAINEYYNFEKGVKNNVNKAEQYYQAKRVAITFVKKEIKENFHDATPPPIAPVVDVDFEKRYGASMQAALNESKAESNSKFIIQNSKLNLGYRKNHNLKKKTQRQLNKLKALPAIEQQYLLDAICKQFALAPIAQTTLNF
jgi:hypothetical protein